MTIQYSIDSEADLVTRVRDTVLYDDTDDEITKSELESQIGNAMLRLKNRTGSDDWYEDDGLGQALLYSACIEAKASLENYSVTEWDVGTGRIDVSGAGDPDQVQFQQWADHVASGLDSSDADGASSTATNIVSNNYVG